MGSILAPIFKKIIPKEVAKAYPKEIGKAIPKELPGLAPIAVAQRARTAEEEFEAGQARQAEQTLLAETGILKKRQATEAKDKAAAEKVIADKETAAVESKKKATALRKRRKATYPYKTVGMEAGLLSGAPVLLKTLLGG